MKRYMDGTKRSLWKGLVAGAVGGLAGTIAMSSFQRAWQTAEKKLSADGADGSRGQERRGRLQDQAQAESGKAEGSAEGRLPEAGNREEQQQQQNGREKEGPTEQVARRVAALASLELSPNQKQNAGQAVHYAFGTLLGAAYGAALELSPESLQTRVPSPLRGLGYGGAVFLGADEIAVPALGLTGKPGEIPLSKHVYGLASHLVYGVVAEIARRAVRKTL